MGLPSHKTGQSIKAARDGFAKIAIPSTHVFCLVVTDYLTGILQCLHEIPKAFIAVPLLWRFLSPGCSGTAAQSAQQVAQADRTGDVETVIVTGTAFNTDVAPAKASLDTMEPQTIINKSYIQDSVADTADYTTILAIAPSMTGQDINGPGLSDGNVKNTLRGLQDGFFDLTYDGIPFGDTNGPTHHSESYFPGVTIGTIDVDRGPGNAGTLGAATFGGSVNMFSENLTHDSHVRAMAGIGSWNTRYANLNLQSGDFDVAGLNNRAMVNLNYTGSYGYLTDQNTDRHELSDQDPDRSARSAGP